MQEKIKILMVLGNTRRGGTQAFILNNLQKLDKSKFQIDFAVNDDFEGGWGPYLRSLGCKIFIVPYFNILNWRRFKNAWEVLLTENRYDIVHGNSTNSAFIYLNVARKHGCRTIAHMHNIGFRGGFFQRIAKNFFSRFAKQHADYWFACSEDAAKVLYGNEYKSNVHYHEIPNAIDVPKYRFNEQIRYDIRKSMGIDDNTFLCGHVGTFSRQKNHTFLLDVFYEIIQRQSNSRLLLIGEGYTKKTIVDKAKGLNILDKIIFVQNISNVNEYMMAMDLFLFPSLYEGFGIVALESQAAGLNTVVSDTVPKAVMLTNAITILSLKDTPSQWAEICISLSQKDRLKLNNEIAQSKYNIEQTASLLSELYTEMKSK